MSQKSTNRIQGVGFFQEKYGKEATRGIEKLLGPECTSDDEEATPNDDPAVVAHRDEKVGVGNRGFENRALAWRSRNVSICICY